MARKRKRILNQISLINKMLLLFLGCVVLPMGILCIRYYSQAQKTIKESMEQKLNSMLEDRAGDINGDFARMASLARGFSRDVELYRAFDTNYKDTNNYIGAYQYTIRSIFEAVHPFYEQVRFCAMYTNNPTVIEGGCVHRLSVNDLSNYDAFEMYLRNEDENAHIYKVNSNKQPIYYRYSDQSTRLSVTKEKNIELFYNLNYYKQFSKYYKWICIEVNISQLNLQLNTPSLFDNFILTDTEGNVIIASKKMSQYKNYSQIVTENGMVVMEKKLDNLPFILYGLYDVNTVLNEIKSVMVRDLPFVVIGLLLALFFVSTIMGNITRRIHQLEEQSKRIACGDFRQNLMAEGGNDEISHLEDSMNQMSFQLKDLIENEYQAEVIRSNLERETTQAKLLALQSQVNPHFMFNALESIRLKALTKKETETARMLKYMSRMFRQLITWDESIICLKDEINFMDEFLHIQEYRFEDEFSYDIQVEENTRECLIPKMMVQQLVENACIHGVEAITNNRYVSVHTWRENNQLVILVCDNGGGMSEEQLSSMMESIKNTQKPAKGVGLSNIYNRLRLYYKDNFSFQVHSTLGKGTECEIRLPAIMNEEEKPNDPNNVC